MDDVGTPTSLPAQGYGFLPARLIAHGGTEVLSDVIYDTPEAAEDAARTNLKPQPPMSIFRRRKSRGTQTRTAAHLPADGGGFYAAFRFDDGGRQAISEEIYRSPAAAEAAAWSALRRVDKRERKRHDDDLTRWEVWRASRRDEDQNFWAYFLPIFVLIIIIVWAANLL